MGNCWKKFRQKRRHATHQTNHRDNLFLRMRGGSTDNSTFVVYTQSLIQAPHISNTFETGQNLGKIKQSTGVFKKKIEKINNNSNTSKQR